MEDFHTPVLLSSVIEQLNIQKGEKYIDATLGGGGYSIEILKRGGRVLGIDLDLEAIEYVREKIKNHPPAGGSKFKVGENLILVQGNFKDIEKLARSHGFDRIAGIVFDLGLSRYQIERSGRGFSFKRSEPLDMRMSGESGSELTAANIVNTWRKEELYELFSKMGEERSAWPIAEHIARTRKIKPILKSDELANLVSQEVREKRSIHPATKVFMALRIAVNNEIGNLKAGVQGSVELLKKDGRLVVVSFHSIEDRLVKQMFKNFENKRIITIVTKKPIIADLDEVAKNASARSAKLRSAQKL